MQEHSCLYITQLQKLWNFLAPPNPGLSTSFRQCLHWQEVFKEENKKDKEELKWKSFTWYPVNFTPGLFSISHRPSLNPFRLFDFPNLSLYSLYGKRSLGPRNALHFNTGNIQKRLKFLLFKKTPQTLTVQMFSLFFCSFHHFLFSFIYLFVCLFNTLALSYCCESDLVDCLTILMFDVAKSCWVSLETTSLIYYINYCWELALEQFMKRIVWRNCLR